MTSDTTEGETAGLQATLLRVLIPVVLALVAGGLILLALGKDPIGYYGYVLQRSLLRWGGFQETLTRMAPLLLIAAGLIVAFRAGLWNLGGDGQFLLAAVASAALAPALSLWLPRGPNLIVCMLVGSLVGALWSLIPALLKARYGVNEIITTLMMSFLGTSLANVMIKLVLRDPDTTVPQTRSLPVDDRLPRLFGTTIHWGLVLAILAVILVHLMMTRTAFGLKIAGSRRQPGGGDPCGIARGAADHRRLRLERRADRSRRRRRGPRRLGHGAGGLEPGLGPAGRPAGVSGALQRLRRHRLHAVLLGADGGRGERRAPGGRARSTMCSCWWRCCCCSWRWSNIWIKPAANSSAA